MGIPCSERRLPHRLRDQRRGNCKVHFEAQSVESWADGLPFTPLVNQMALQDHVHLEAPWTLVCDLKPSGAKEDSRPSLLAMLTERAKDSNTLALARVLAEMISLRAKFSREQRAILTR